jgi:hypothetical protein
MAQPKRIQNLNLKNACNFENMEAVPILFKKMIFVQFLSIMAFF